MTTMVEKIARALCIEAGELPDTETPYNPHASYLWMHYRHSAIAALEAMKEPSEEMIVAGCRVENMGDMAGRFNAMISAALSEGREVEKG